MRFRGRKPVPGQRRNSATHPKPRPLALHRPRERHGSPSGFLPPRSPQRLGAPLVSAVGGRRPGLDWAEVRRQKGGCESEWGRVRGKVCDFLTSERRPFSPKPPFLIQGRKSLSAATSRPRTPCTSYFWSGSGALSTDHAPRRRRRCRYRNLPPTKGACATGGPGPRTRTRTQIASLLQGACVDWYLPSGEPRGRRRVQIFLRPEVATLTSPQLCHVRRGPSWDLPHRPDPLRSAAQNPCKMGKLGPALDTCQRNNLSI